MALPPGTRIGVFEIVAKLGEGGMGEVYRARDTRLDRDVALKVLPQHLTSDPERLARFEREAKVLAQLNHSNIAQVYGFEHAAAGSAHTAIAMELVEGPTLDDAIREHAAGIGAAGLPLDRALAIARQIATALEVAHDQGIVHRDLKPANIKVREDGTVKVLDFGLAKAFAADSEAQQSAVSNSPTLTARSTQLGMIIGTAAYMSPEQAKARPVDRRADVWAFGVVLFEMLSGRRAFDGDDVSDVLASVLKTDPDWSVLPADAPPPVRRLLRRCLEKDPKKRLRDIAEGMLQLEEGLAAGSMTSTVTAAGASTSNLERRTSHLRRALPIAATAAATTLIVAGIGIWRTPAPAPLYPMRSQYTPPASSPFLATGAHRDVAISPDGRKIAYSIAGAGGAPQIAVRALDQLEGVPVRGIGTGLGPFFSPDGEWIGFVDTVRQTEIKRIPLLGGPPVSITVAPSRVLGAAWTAEGILFGREGGPLGFVPESGGQPVDATTLDAGEMSHLWPSAVPGTSVVLFTTTTALTSSVQTQLAALDRATGRAVRLKIDGRAPRFVTSGHIVYATDDGSLRAVAFDSERMAVTGPPAPLQEVVGLKPTGAAGFDVSETGHMVFAGAGRTQATRTLAWVDRSGRETPITAPARAYFYVYASPDGTRLALDTRDEEQDIWIWDIKREALTRLTDTPAADQYGLWTRQNQIVFNSTRLGRMELFRHRPDGIGEPERITDTTAENLIPFPSAITPDGHQVIFRTAPSANSKTDLWVVDVPTRKMRKLLATEHAEYNAALSPAGDYMVFESDLSGGRPEVFVRPFPDVDAWQSKVSIEGGREPVWSPTGKEIFYLAGGQMMSMPVSRVGGTLQLGKPVPLFKTDRYFFGAIGRNYDISHDGSRFVMVKAAEAVRDSSPPLTIVMNWVEELRARLR